MVTSFANPGGNLTGLTNMNVELSGKRTEVLIGDCCRRQNDLAF